MTNIENYKSIARRTGITKVPIEFSMCPSLREKFVAYVKETGLEFKMATATIYDAPAKRADNETFLAYYNRAFKEGTVIDHYGVAHEPGSAAAFHMKKMHSPMVDFDSEEQILLRLAGARKELSYWKQYGYLVINDDLDTAAADLAALFRSFRLKTPRQDQELFS